MRIIGTFLGGLAAALIIALPVRADEGCAQRSRAVAEAMIDAVNDHDHQRLAGLLSADFKRHTQTRPELPVIEGRDAFLQAHKRDVDAFPDIRYRAEIVSADCGMVAVLGRYEGTHQGAFQGLPPSGRWVSVELATFHRVKDGVVTESWYVWDRANMMMQMGATEPFIALLKSQAAAAAAPKPE